MNSVSYDVTRLPTVLTVGRQTETGVMAVRIDCTGWLTFWPGLTLRLFVTAPGGAAAYPAKTHMEGKVLVWDVNSADTQTAGKGTLEVVGESGGKRKCSAIVEMNILRTTTATTTEPPEEIRTWYDEVMDGVSTTEAAMAGVNSAVSRANAAVDRANSVTADMEAATPAIVQNVSGDSITMHDSADRPLRSLTVYGKTTQDGTPTMSTPVQMTHAAQDGTLTVSIGEQSATIATVGGLRGATITDDRAAYTHKDASGAKWYADSIERRENGTAVLVRRIHFERLTSTSRNWAASGAMVGRYNINVPKPTPASYIAPICSSLQGSTWSSDSTEGVVFSNKGSQLCFNTGLATLDEWKAYLDSNEVYLAYAMLEPEEIELTPEEAAALLALRTLYHETTINNDAGVHMVVDYVADTKTYIDNLVASAVAVALANQ